MTQIFGDFKEMENSRHEYLKISFSPTSRPLQQRWRNNGLSADFLADYLSTFFPGEDSSSQERQAEIKDAVNFIANELLENARPVTGLLQQFFIRSSSFLCQKTSAPRRRLPKNSQASPARAHGRSPWIYHFNSEFK